MNIANKHALSIMVNSRYLLPDRNSQPRFVGVLPRVFMEGTSRKGVPKVSRYVFDSFKIHTLFFSFSIRSGSVHAQIVHILIIGNFVKRGVRKITPQMKFSILSYASSYHFCSIQNFSQLPLKDPGSAELSAPKISD